MYSTRISTYRSNKRWITVTSIVAVLIIMSVAGYFGYNRWRNSQKILPTTVKDQLTFPFYWPDKTAPLMIDKKTIKYDANSKAISYIAQTSDGAVLTISQQATPQSFTDVPQAYSKLVEILVQYGVFDSPNGTVYLTHPKQLKGGQTAVMNSKGTLVFVKPDKNLSDDTWHKVFNNLKIIQQ